MKKLSLSFSIILIILILSGCATYKIGSETFYSSAEEFKKQSEIFSGILYQIKPSQNPAGGTASIILPSDDEIQKKYVSFNIRTSQESINFVVAAVKNGNQFMADAILKRSIFDSTIIEYHNGNPFTNNLEKNDFAIIRDIDGWFLKERNKALIIPLPIDKNKTDGFPCTEAFLDEVNRQAISLRVK